MPYPDPPAWTLPDPWIVGDLRLRLPRSRDVDRLVTTLQAEDVQRFTMVPSPYTREDAEWFVGAATDGVESGTSCHLLIVDTVSDDLLGGIGMSVDWRDGTAELGYWVAPAARRRHVASRAARAMVGFAFELGVGRVWLRAAANNPGSNGVARTVGFTHEGTHRSAAIDGPSGDLAAPRADMEQWGILPGELA